MRKPAIRAILSAALIVSCVAVWTDAMAAKGDPKLGKQKYMENMRCLACHGESGKGDGPAAVALNPKPRNYTDCAVMSKKSDAELFKVIKEGGAAAGLSPLMVAFGSQLSDKEIWDVVAFIRSDRKSTRLNSSHIQKSRMPSSA